VAKKEAALVGAPTSGTIQAKLEFPEYRLNPGRAQRQAEAFHRLGPRALGEFLAEIIARCPELQERLDAYSRLTPEALRIAGADDFPPHVFEVAS